MTDITHAACSIMYDKFEHGAKCLRKIAPSPQPMRWVNFGVSAEMFSHTTCTRRVDMQKCAYPNDGKQDLQLRVCMQKLLHGTAKRWHACLDSIR